MIVAVGVDHAGAVLHEAVTEKLVELGHVVLDLGQCDDYPDMALAVGKAIDSGEAERGVLICGSGAGIGVAASKIPGIYAQTVHDTYTAHQAVEHDGLNVLCMGGRVIGTEVAKEIVTAFVSAQVSEEERHVRRRAKVQLIANEGLAADLEGVS